MSKRSEPSTEEFISNSSEETRAWGKKLAQRLGDWACILLVGNLGAGKTTLVKGIAEELGIDPNAVTSPTFVLIREHYGRIRLIHADAYRAASTKEFIEVGLAEYLEQPGIVVIEWGEKLAELVPAHAIWIRIEILDGTRRRISLSRDGRA
ncbi:tRNA (adenosine(37)-N6)-threonylcarbamoyltransferase complex ATPase subunit type 1 TsaE [Candidatus Acetothermia bacterium]|nr:tRNA (adenosine(37)-N6)-threonylcarbamoyltransferase complex ATPase subunit type 1 TsaE [Candidatus Acetothermia bacterium]MBI3643080.1 tRNA (adenosine(37)-N6)-threonylcarbamoyltransferase complex ATPase subunit type 1 TsaE [Candidatus Acetothermia bacterium]